MTLLARIRRQRARRKRGDTLRTLARVNAQLAERDADLLTLDSATVIRLLRRA